MSSSNALNLVKENFSGGNGFKTLFIENSAKDIKTIFALNPGIVHSVNHRIPRVES